LRSVVVRHQTLFSARSSAAGCHFTVVSAETAPEMSTWVAGAGAMASAASEITFTG